MLKNNLKKINFNMNILNNEYISWGLRIILVLYAAMVAPNLNKEISNIFDNVIVRLILACLIVFLSFHDTTLAILLAISFVVSIQTLNKHKVNTITNPTESFYGDDNTEENEQEQYTNDEDTNDEAMNDESMNDEAMNDEAMNDEAMNGESSTTETFQNNDYGQEEEYRQEDFYNFDKIQSETSQENCTINNNINKTIGNNTINEQQTKTINSLITDNLTTPGYDKELNHYPVNFN
jgi:hypothetical protein